MRRIFSIIILLATVGVMGCMAQVTDPLMAHYWAMPTLYNPAATGSVDYVRIRGGARLQWLGIEHAPKTFAATADMPVRLGKNRLGVGVALQQDGVGLFSNLDLGVQASYKLRLLGGSLGIGMQASYFNTGFKGSEVILPDGDDFHESGDEAIPTTDLTGSTVDLDFGLWYTHKHWWAGLSARHLLAPKVTMSLEGSESNESQEYEVPLDRMFYFSAGGNIPINNTLFELQPSLIAGTDLHAFTGQIDMRAMYNRFLSFGVGYRYKAGINVSLGAEFKNFYLGYSYEYPLSAIAKASSGSHEVVAGYQLKLDFSQKNKNKHRAIRLM